LTFSLSAQEVGPNGELVYSYPIKLPPGTNGVGPELALGYNSFSGNGMCGLCWSLSGIPVIGRDGSYEIDFSKTDKEMHYIFNGQKLIYTDSANDGDGYFHTERESFVRIQAEGTADSIDHWIITQKGGTKMYFGYMTIMHSANTDGRVEALGHSGRALLWSLSKVEDVHGNYYIIEYNEDIEHGDYYPRRITYTKNDAHPLNAYRKVEFSYEPRTDHGPLYIPTLMDVDKRLKYIMVFVGGNLLRKYRLDYEYSSSTGRSRLVEIQEYGSGGDWPTTLEVDPSYVPEGSVLPAVSFEWSEKGDGTFQDVSLGTESGITDISWEHYNVCGRGDFNGDGLSDLYLFHAREDGRSKGDPDDHVWLSNGDGTFQDVSLETSSGITGEEYHKYGVCEQGDFNGDGLSDLYLFHARDDGRSKGSSDDHVWLGYAL
jgi:hypothetical protein